MTHAIVKTTNGATYVSPLFAVKFAGGESAAIGLDPSLSYAQKLDFWLRVREKGCPCFTSRRSLYIVSYEYGDAHKTWSGMDWLMKDQDLMERLLAGDRIPLTEDSRFAPYAAPITLPAWFEVNTPTDAASLETVSFQFHDAEPIACTQTDADLTVTLDTTWGCVITVRFLDVIEDTFTGRVGCILDSHVEKTAEGVIFTVLNGYGGWIDGIEFDTPAENAFVRCQRILWQIRIDRSVSTDSDRLIRIDRNHRKGSAMTSKIASILTKIGNAVSIAALAIVVIAPIMWLDSPYLSVWPLAHALCILWAVTPKTHKLWDLWLSAVFRVAVTVWEIVDVTFFSEGIHPSVSVGLYVLLGGAVLYLVGVALWSIGRKTHAEQEETE